MLPTLQRSPKQPSPIGLLLFSILSVQFGSALAKSLFGELGPWGVVALRVTFSAVFFFVVWRLRWNAKVRENIVAIVAFGLILAAMNSAFYAAIDRIPLGVAITLEFVGPLGLAILKSQRLLDLLWAGLAIAGIGDMIRRHFTPRPHQRIHHRHPRHGSSLASRFLLGALHPARRKSRRSPIRHRRTSLGARSQHRRSLAYRDRNNRQRFTQSEAACTRRWRGFLIYNGSLFV